MQFSSGGRVGNAWVGNAGGNAAQAACLEIDERLANFFLRVHDERAIAGDRLVDRLPRHDENARAFGGFDLDRVAGALEHHELLALRALDAVHADAALEDEHSAAPAFAERQLHLAAGAQLYVEE